MIRKLIFICTLSLTSIALLAQDGSSCSTPLPVTCNKYMHIDNLFEGTLTDNGAMPCVDDFQEVAGIWLELKIGRSGQLAFDLVPDDPDQDLDFTLFKGNDCGALEAVRCVGGGRSADGHSDCMGATGLRADEADYFEIMGCSEGQNNYGAALEVNQNERLLLFVHGFKSEDHGFGVSFGNVIMGVANSINEAVSVQWADEGDLTLEYNESFTNLSEVVWTVNCGENQQLLFGRGPHRQHIDDYSHLNWKITSIQENECIIELSGDLSPFEFASSTLIWPSPTTGFIFIHSDRFFTTDDEFKIDLLNNQGVVVFSKTFLSDKHKNIGFNIDFLPSGMFWIVLEENELLGTIIKE